MTAETLAILIENYIHRRYHTGPMHITQLNFLRGMVHVIRSRDIEDMFFAQVEEVANLKEATASTYFASIFLDTVLPF